MKSDLPPPDVVLAGHFEPGQEKRYYYRPFEVPPGVQQLHVRYDYSERIPADPLLVGGNTLDIGLFDERGLESGGPGFRGWSGSARLAFTIDRDWSTPPYLPGPIGAGVWHFLLGPYRVGPRGLDYRVDVWFNAGLAPEPRAPGPAVARVAERIPPAAEPGWLRGDLHCHTIFSDGDSWPEEVLRAAAAAGLDFVSLSDHNSVRPAGYWPVGPGLPLAVPGVEVTTYGGHWNAWGIERWIDFREPSAGAVEAEMRAAATDGALVCVNHPRPFGPVWEYQEARGYHAVEVWNGDWDRLNSISLAFWEAHLERGERIVALGGSDAHLLRGSNGGPLPRARLGCPTTWVKVEGAASVEGILAALRAGRAFISADPAGPQLYLRRADPGLEARVVGARGSVLVVVADGACVAATAITADDWQSSFVLPPGARYGRAQVATARGTLIAMSNPLWLDSA